ncbi:MAG TPA: BamA/TamA family outer membrane protein [Vicinamibacteria bacterium]|nr:BamA/TamA family outer membrane protein [Vicinamibacteria bacterium]
MLARLLLLAAASAPPAAPSGLLGRPIAEVTVDAPPEVAARLRRYVELRPGVELRAEDVRHVVELIHATGEYADVQVEARLRADGVQVVLRPLPAPVLEAVRVKGDGPFSAREVRRLTRLHEREALWPARLERAVADVRAALAEQGYAAARVHAAAEPAAGPAAAVFTVAAGPRQQVSRARVTGVEPWLQSVLGPAVRPRPGEPWVRARAQEAAEEMRRALVRRGRWGARVEVKEGVDAAGPAVDLAFAVADAGRTRVELRGAELPEGLRQAVLKTLREGAVQADALEEASERIEEAFLRRGHRQVAVSHAQEARGDEQVVVYTVEPGPAAVVASLRVATEEVTGLEPLLAVRAGAPLVERTLGEDVRALQRELESRGFAQAQVQVEVPEGAGALPVVFRVREGPRLSVRSVRVDSPLGETVPGGPRELRLRPGQPYRVADLARDNAAVLTAYRDAGYPQAEVVPEVAVDAPAREVDVVLRVRPGARILVDHVVIGGLTRTREAVVRRELLVAEGAPLGLQKVLESQRRLAALGIFERVSISELDPESGERRSLLVAAEEAPLTTVAYGVGYAERDRVRGSVEVTRRNLFGMDRSLSTFARVSFRGSRLLTTFREPYLLGRRQELFVTGFREEEDREAFDFVRWGAIVQTARPLRPGWNLIVRYSFQETHSFNIVDPDDVGREFTDSTLSGPSTSLVMDTRDDPLDPRRGRFVSADLQLSHEWLGGDSFAKGFFQAATYEAVGPRAVLAVSGRLGLARTFGLGDSLLLPRPDRFYAGGDYSLRGFRIDAVNPLGGNALLLGGVELRLDTWRDVSTALFAEAGNVFPLVSRLDAGELRYTAGVGLRYRSAFGPLRVDWGFKLDRRAGESLSRLHLTVGHAF